MGTLKMVRFLGALVALVLGVVFVSQVQAGWFGGKKKDDPVLMPAFELTQIPDKNDFDSAQLAGKVVLINFWATWCGPCVAEYPDLMKLHTAYKAKGFTMIGISMDQSSGGVKKFMEKAGAVYPMLMADSSVSRDFNAGSGLPMSFLVDRQGKIIKKYYGPRSYEVFAKDIEGLL
jgi:thiol-disulfide isomerase/thioredoxin